MNSAMAGGRSAPRPSPSRSRRTCCSAPTRSASRARRRRRSWRMRIEQTLTKERILELYLNEIYLGVGAYGVAAAAQAYFNKPLDQLDACRGRLPRRAAQGAEQLQSVPLPRRREGAARLGARPHGGRPRDHRPSRPPRPRPSRSCRPPSSRPETVPGGEWFAEEVRRQLVDHFGADLTTDRAAARCAPASTRRCRPRPTRRCATG